MCYENDRTIKEKLHDVEYYLRYEGDYMDDCWSGRGTLYLDDGTYYIGTWLNGFFIDSGTYYWNNIEKKMINMWKTKQEAMVAYKDRKIEVKFEQPYCCANLYKETS